jgi:hypothetical protein
MKIEVHTDAESKHIEGPKNKTSGTVVVFLAENERMRGNSLRYISFTKTNRMIICLALMPTEFSIDSDNALWLGKSEGFGNKVITSLNEGT